MMEQKPRSPYVWDYDIDQDQFLAIRAGRDSIGRLDQDWAAIRLLEYTPYPEIVRIIGFRRILAGWQRWRPHIRSLSRRRGFDYLVDWLPAHRPELLT